MIKNSLEEKARKEILSLVKNYADTFHKENEYKRGDKISYAKRVYDSDEMVNLVDSALEFWLTSGRYTEKFEKNFAEYLGVKYCSLVNSGSSANLLAFMALTSPLLEEKQIKPGDEVITVAAGFPTTVAPMVQYGAIPVFVDVTIPQYNIDVSQLKEALSSKTKAVMIAHTLGNPFDLKYVKSFCDENGLWLIEDNCDALGSKYKHKNLTWILNAAKKNPEYNFVLTGNDSFSNESEELNREKVDNVIFTGFVSDGEMKALMLNCEALIQPSFYEGFGIPPIEALSFYPPHHMTMGEGGAVYTNNALLSKIIRSLRDWGRDCVCPSGVDNFCKHRFDKQYGDLPIGYDHKYVYSHFGYNLKATDMQAAVGCAQLKKFPSFVEKRKHNFNRLREALSKISDKVILPEPCENSEPSWFGFLITCKAGIDRNKVVNFIENNGIQTRMLFAGNIIKHPCFDQMRKLKSGYRVVGKLKNTDRIMNDSFWVGVYPGMNDEMIDYMAETVVGAVENE